MTLQSVLLILLRILGIQWVRIKFPEDFFCGMILIYLLFN